MSLEWKKEFFFSLKILATSLMLKKLFSYFYQFGLLKFLDWVCLLAGGWWEWWDYIVILLHVIIFLIPIRQYSEIKQKMFLLVNYMLETLISIVASAVLQ